MILLLVFHLGHGNGNGVDDILNGTASGKVGNGLGESLEEGTVGTGVAESLGNFISDVSGLEVGEHQGIGLTGHGRSGSLFGGYAFNDGGIEAASLRRRSVREPSL